MARARSNRNSIEYPPFNTQSDRCGSRRLDKKPIEGDLPAKPLEIDTFFLCDLLQALFESGPESRSAPVLALFQALPRSSCIRIEAVSHSFRAGGG